MKGVYSTSRSLVLSTGVIYALFTPLIAGAESPVSTMLDIKTHSIQIFLVLISFAIVYLVTKKIESVLVKRWNPKLAFCVAIFIGTLILYVALIQVIDLLYNLLDILFTPELSSNSLKA